MKETKMSLLLLNVFKFGFFQRKNNYNFLTIFIHSNVSPFGLF
jgi:hypothetical protein